MYKIDDQCKLDAWSRALKASALEQPEGWVGEGGGREVQNGGHACVPKADLCQCVTGATTVLWSDCPPVKINK